MNIYEIAKEAGVSIATISRVVNGKSVVSGKTREKVEAILKKYNYTPDPAARGLAAKATKSVAILASDIREPGCGAAAYLLERKLAGMGYASLLWNTGGSSQGIADSIRTAVYRHADAVVVIGMPDEAEEAVAEAARSVPFVLVNHALDAPGVYTVLCDESYGMMLAVGELVGRGRSDILFVKDSDDVSAKRLAEGFNAGMEMNSFSPEGQIVTTERGAEGGFAVAESMIRSGRTFDAAVCGDDTTAAGLMQCLRQNFIEVPGDISVIGFHNTAYAECTAPALTSVDCRPEKMGEIAAKLLVSLLNGETPDQSTVILPRLIRRESI